MGGERLVGVVGSEPPEFYIENWGRHTPERTCLATPAHESFASLSDMLFVRAKTQKMNVLVHSEERMHQHIHLLPPGLRAGPFGQKRKR